ncbi:MAG: MFS transporter [Steroidobacteraceae bacterium]|jgi:MFS family permease|nr:MFS transporter [Gammaproteobacteria bacterium]
MIKLTRYQWTVLAAAWLGWGFDIFDSLLFNYVAPNAIPTLLGLELGSAAARAETLYWTGVLTAIFLLGWAAGGVLFGPISDRFGRRKVLMWTMVMYAVGTAACAMVTNIEQLILCRIVASLGIGGEWAAGCALVAEVVPEDQRVEAGALLYTSAPLGLFLATGVNSWIAGNLLSDNPEFSWRVVLLFGLVPAAFAFVVRLFIKEPERWKSIAATAAPARLREIFSPELWPRTRSALLMTLVALLMWWSCNAFIPVVSANLAQAEAALQGLDRNAASILIESWKTQATTFFNIGGLIGTLLTIPIAKKLGRRPMFAIYFAGSAIALMSTFGLDLEPQTRLYMYFFVGLTVFGIFGSFTFYLPELFPTRLRATGSGFCYNIGRVIAAGGPFLVGSIAAAGAGDPSVVLRTLFMVGFVPVVGLLLMRWVIETRGQAMPE